MKYIDNAGNTHDDIMGMVRSNVMESNPVSTLRNKLGEISSHRSKRSHADDVSTDGEYTTANMSHRTITIDYDNGFVNLEDEDGNILVQSKISEDLNIDKNRADAFVLAKLLGEISQPMDVDVNAVIDEAINGNADAIDKLQPSSHLSLYDAKKMSDLLDCAGDIASKAMEINSGAVSGPDFFKKLFKKLKQKIHIIED